MLILRYEALVIKVHEGEHGVRRRGLDTGRRGQRPDPLARHGVSYRLPQGQGQRAPALKSPSVGVRLEGR